jgi:2-polyprenyl-3-methyl-5-hydroxy-6-metoxy-1,4-benzoquinol methylase
MGTLVSFVKDGEKVGDVGCGSGQFARVLAVSQKPAAILGLEIDAGLIANARKMIEGTSNIPATFDVFDGERFPDELADLDVIFLNDVLHHIGTCKQQTFLRQLVQKLRGGARLVLKDIDADSLLVVFNKLHDKLLSGDGGGNEIGCCRAIEMLGSVGLEVISVVRERRWWYPHYIVECRKKTA